MSGYDYSDGFDISGGNVYGISKWNQMQLIYTGGLVAEPHTR